MMISVVIPIYNCEKYIERCIESILKQTYTDFELLLINDGSTDKSLELIHKYEKIDERIKVFDIKNKGVANARNVGIANANGDYITFVDGDDVIAPFCFQNAINTFNEYSCDIVVGQVKKTVIAEEIFKNESKVLLVSKGKDSSLIFNSLFSENILNSEENDWKYLVEAPVAKFFITQKIKSYQFPNGIKISEDTIWNYKVLDGLENDSKIAFISQGWYLYIQNDFSALHSYKEGFDDIVLEAVNFLNVLVFKNDGNFSGVYIDWVLAKLQQIVESYYLNKNNNDGVLNNVTNLRKKVRNIKKLGKIDICHKTKKQTIKWFLYRAGLAVLYYKIKKDLLPNL